MNILKKVGIAFGYLLFFVLCTVLFVRFLFPTRQAKEFAALKLAEATGAETVTIRDLGISGLIPSGVEIEGLEMTLPGVKKKTTERNGSVIGPKRIVAIDKITADVGSISGLMNGAPDVSFDLAMAGGTVKGGHYKRDKGGPHIIKIEKIDGVALGVEQLFQSLVGMDIQGVLSGSVDLTVPTEARDNKDVMLLDQMTGTVDLQLANAIALEPIVELAGAREKLTDIELGEIRIKLAATNGGASAAAAPATGDRPAGKREGTVVSLEEASALGGDLSVGLQKGTLTFQAGQPTKDARLNIHLAVKPEDSFYNKEVEDPANPGKMTTPNKRLKSGIELTLKNKLTDGQIGIAITGTVGEPKVATEKPRAKVNSTGGTASSRKMNIDHPGGEEGSGEGEEGKARPSKTDKIEKTDKSEKTNGEESHLNTRRNPPIGGRPTTPVRPTSERPRPVLPTEPIPVEPDSEHHEPETAPTPVPDPNTPPPVEGVPPEGDPGVDPNAPPAEEPQPQ